MLRIFATAESKEEIFFALFVYLIMIFLITPVHEFAHAWTAYKLGDDTAKLKGRLTLNPIASLDARGTVALLLFGFGWGKPVPVNPLRFKKYRKGMALTAAAGPISNFILAMISIMCARFVWVTYALGGGQSYKLQMLYFSIYLFARLNVGLAVFNLLPIPPLDGQKILAYFTPKKFDDWVRDHIIYIYGIALALIYFTNVLGYVSEFVYNCLYRLFFFIDYLAVAVMS